VKIVVTGASGLIGTALVTRLHASGHEVVRLVRRPPRAGDEVQWDPERGTVDVDGLTGVDGAVHLAGAGVGDHRWTDDYKRQIRDSRVLGTRTLVDALTRLDPLPRVLVSGSAVGYYGSRGDEVLTETSGAGEGFLADVVRAWEAEAAPAAKAGIRVSYARTGLVMAPTGGAFGRLLPLLKLGVAGPLGNGRQWWPWITLEDETAALEFLLEKDVEGPVNLSAPNPQRQGELTKALGRAFRRPALLPAPAIALRAVLGEFAADVLASQRMLPKALLDAGFSFRHPDLDSAAEWLRAQS
jgi:hypothetical protein